MLIRNGISEAGKQPHDAGQLIRCESEARAGFAAVAAGQEHVCADCTKKPGKNLIPILICPVL